ncbi:MAG TPA: M20/M25/M40 family metallo-hydrolase [Clostridia bacterium]|nr:M20/M25/M40 family metallo-hydrolase [Clostridia bacterium]
MSMGLKIILGILILLGVFIIITLIRAAFFTPQKRTIPKIKEEKVDTQRVAKHLSGAIQIPTVSYPEHERVDWSQFERFHKYLEDSYPLIHKTLKKELIDKASLLYRWKGKNSKLEPIALLSHQDVVPVSKGTEDDWKHPAFSGHNDGEFIWGRGALDMKNHLICVMEAIETLIEEGFEPERDVYLCFGHDEEVVASQSSGAKSIMETLKSRGVKLDSVIDEGGAILPVNIKGIISKNLAGIGIAEKGYADFEISLNSKGGHSSQPPKHTAIGEMADVVKDLENHQFKAKMMPFATEMFLNIGRNVSYPARIVTCNIKLLKPLIKLIMTKIPPAACLVRTTTAVTMSQGSPAANVLPQIVSVTANFRMMPGTTTADVEKHIKKVVKNKNIKVKMLKSKEASCFSPTHGRAFDVIEQLCIAENPDNIIAPYLVMGGTDASFYEPICDNIYRFAPFHVTTSLLLCTHATNERVPVETLKDGVAFFKRYVRTLSSS